MSWPSNKNLKLERFERDLNWLDERPLKFRRRYGSKFVAVRDMKVVAQDRELKSLTGIEK